MIKLTDTGSRAFVSKSTAFQLYLYLHSFVYKNIHIYAHTPGIVSSYYTIQTYTIYVNTVSCH